MNSSISTRYTASTSIADLGSVNTSYLKPNSFKFVVAKLPNVTYTCQAANLPALTLGQAIQPTPFVDISHPGDKVQFGDFTIQFLVNEDLSNYKELYDWIVQIGVPSGSTNWGTSLNRASVWPVNDPRGAFSDCALIVVNSNNIPVVRIKFEDAFPISLEGLSFDITSSGMEYFTGVATFRYKVFTIEQVGK
jgi:hypothetical protein